jgi:hypothetical protein
VKQIETFNIVKEEFNNKFLDQIEISKKSIRKQNKMKRIIKNIGDTIKETQSEIKENNRLMVQLGEENTKLKEKTVDLIVRSQNQSNLNVNQIINKTENIEKRVINLERKMEENMVIIEQLEVDMANISALIGFALHERIEKEKECHNITRNEINSNTEVILNKTNEVRVEIAARKDEVKRRLAGISQGGENYHDEYVQLFKEDEIRDNDHHHKMLQEFDNIKENQTIILNQTQTIIEEVKETI